MDMIIPEQLAVFLERRGDCIAISQQDDENHSCGSTVTVAFTNLPALIAALQKALEGGDA